MLHPYNLGRLFANVCALHAERVAIKYAGRQMTYGELDRLSGSYAAHLIERGLVPNDVVAIVNTKEPESLALMLACLKLGVAYTNIDRDNPIQRTQAILDQCRPRLVVADAPPTPDLALLCQRSQVDLGETSSLPTSLDSSRVAAARDLVTGSRIAYIMFTSGSTGIPKGAVITHRNVLSFIGWTTEQFPLSTADVFANVSPFYFDNSVFDFYSALFTGACIAPMNKALVSRPIDLLNAVDALGCTIWFSVPSLLIYLATVKALDPTRFRSIRAVVFGGEGFPKSELHKLYSLFSHRMQFINVYGPTEGTCICSSYTLGPSDFTDLSGLPPLGSMNPNFDYLILNENNEKADRGELCILGPNVGLGYYRDPERSKAVFVEYSAHGHYGDRMYRTGDLVYEANGLLYFLGRADNQVKHMGYRIELEEIESALNAVTGVIQAAVIYERVSASYGKIVAFVACSSPLPVASLKEELKKKLPEYMIPNVIRTSPVLPKNANGKVDRRQLRELYCADQGAQAA